MIKMIIITNIAFYDKNDNNNKSSFCIALFFGLHKLAALYNILRHFQG